MAAMSKKAKLTENDIDRIVVSQADDDSAWEKPMRVHKAKSASVSIPAGLAARAAFLAQIHRTKNLEEWLTHVIEERIELEEAAFIGAKQDLSTKAG
jgi:fructose-1-phosphate kinase PfkB-like protein